MVESFFQTYNTKDSLAHFDCLHQDFTQTWEGDQISIPSKKDYADNYSWGHVMEDHEDYKITSTTESSVIVSSEYYSFRDSILDLGPFKCTKTFLFEDGKIIQIDEQGIEDSEAYHESRSQIYDRFFQFARHFHDLGVEDFPFSRDGAILLKGVLEDYASYLEEDETTHIISGGDYQEEAYYEAAFEEADSNRYYQNGNLLQEGELEGEFLSFDIGDYNHVSILDSDSKVHHFLFSWDEDEEEFLADICCENPEKYKHKSVKAHWKRERITIPQMEEPSTVIYTVYGLTFLEEINGELIVYQYKE